MCNIVKRWSLLHLTAIILSCRTAITFTRRTVQMPGLFNWLIVFHWFYCLYIEHLILADMSRRHGHEVTMTPELSLT